MFLEVAEWKTFPENRTVLRDRPSIVAGHIKLFSLETSSWQSNFSKSFDYETNKRTLSHPVFRPRALLLFSFFQCLKSFTATRPVDGQFYSDQFCTFSQKRFTMPTTPVQSTTRFPYDDERQASGKFFKHNSRHRVKCLYVCWNILSDHLLTISSVNPHLYTRFPYSLSRYRKKTVSRYWTKGDVKSQLKDRWLIITKRNSYITVVIYVGKYFFLTDCPQKIRSEKRETQATNFCGLISFFLSSLFWEERKVYRVFFKFVVFIRMKGSSTLLIIKFRFRIKENASTATLNAYTRFSTMNRFRSDGRPFPSITENGKLLAKPN